jgi:hypothetical protein
MTALVFKVALFLRCGMVLVFDVFSIMVPAQQGPESAKPKRFSMRMNFQEDGLLDIHPQPRKYNG